MVFPVTILWVAGIDDGGQLRLAANTYRQGGSDFFTGPIATNYAPVIIPGVYDSTYFYTYDNIWEIDEALIFYHQTNYNTVGYVTPYVIANWPANPNQFLGINAPLAPYVDVDNDGIYNPINGDYPKIIGNKALYFMFNDDRLPHSKTGGLNMGIEIRGLAYSFDLGQNDDLNNTIFVNYTIHNKSNNNYTDFRVATWFDLCAGCYLDNASSCDTSLNSFFSYNLYPLDTNSNINRFCYNDIPPAIGTTFLNKKISSYVRYNMSDDSILGNPIFESDFYNYMIGKKKSGDFVNADCDLYDNNKPSTFNFPGDPNDLTSVSEIVCDTFIQPHFFPRHISSIEPVELKSGESICLDLAFTFAQDESGNNSHLKSVTDLKQRIQNIQNLYNQGSLGCSGLSTSIIDKGIDNIEANIFPNPVENSFSITINNNATNQISVYDIAGKKVYETQFVKVLTVNTSNWNNSLYTAQISNKNNNIIKRFIKM
jgi:hypothetical protein